MMLVVLMMMLVMILIILIILMIAPPFLLLAVGRHINNDIKKNIVLMVYVSGVDNDSSGVGDDVSSDDDRYPLLAPCGRTTHCSHTTTSPGKTRCFGGGSRSSSAHRRSWRVG